VFVRICVAYRGRQSIIETPLKRANLATANLEGAILQAANLKNAHLEGAVLRGASVEGANLEGAFLTN
jgi:uncharacterized protein YjbI with pentapeptide repeats